MEWTKLTKSGGVVYVNLSRFDVIEPINNGGSRISVTLNGTEEDVVEIFVHESPEDIMAIIAAG